MRSFSSSNFSAASLELLLVGQALPLDFDAGLLDVHAFALDVHVDHLHGLFALGTLGRGLRVALGQPQLRLVLHLGRLAFGVGFLDRHVRQHVGVGLLADLVLVDRLLGGDELLLRPRARLRRSP